MDRETKRREVEEVQRPKRSHATLERERHDLVNRVHSLQNRITELSDLVAELSDADREIERYKHENADLVEALQEIADGQGKYAKIAADVLGQ